jgi:hypothetical protein
LAFSTSVLMSLAPSFGLTQRKMGEIAIRPVEAKAFSSS